MIRRVPLMLGFLTILLAISPIVRADNEPYKQTKNVVFAEVDGVGLVMDVFTPTGTPNGLGIVDVASGSFFSDRGKIEDHRRARVYDIFCGKGYTMFAVRPGSISRRAVELMKDLISSSVVPHPIQSAVSRHAAGGGSVNRPTLSDQQIGRKTPVGRVFPEVMQHGVAGSVLIDLINSAGVIGAFRKTGSKQNTIRAANQRRQFIGLCLHEVR